MTPRHTSDGLIGTAVGNSEFVCYRLDGKASLATRRPKKSSSFFVERTHLENVGFCESCIPMGRTRKHDLHPTQNAVAMLLIIAWGYSLKVLKPIVMLVAVFVIDLMAAWDWATEGFEYQTVNRKFLLRLIPVKSDAHVSLGIQSAKAANTITASICPTRDAFDSPEIAYFVDGCVTLDGFPLFTHGVIVPCQ